MVNRDVEVGVYRWTQNPSERYWLAGAVSAFFRRALALTMVKMTALFNVDIHVVPLLL